MQHSKIVINKYQDWIHVDRLIQPKRNIFINADHPSLPNLRPLSKLIYLQVEPDIVIASRSFLLANWRFYKHIITYDDVVLSNCPNAVKYVFATCWIPQQDYENIDISLKKFQISSLVGSKSFAPGHTLRHELYMRQRELTDFPLTIYISTHGTPLLNISNNVLLPNGAKMSLFKEFQFSIVIENVSQNTWFTEKLIDCLITKTIPIYWGCPSISDYFDTTGWIIFSDVNDLKQKLSLLNDSYYYKYTDVIDKNYKSAKLYIDIHGNLNRAIRTIPNW